MNFDTILRLDNIFTIFLENLWFFKTLNKDRILNHWVLKYLIHLTSVFIKCKKAFLWIVHIEGKA